MHVFLSPEDGSVEVFCVSAVNGVQIAGAAQFVCELAPGHLKNLISDVTLNDLHKVLHLMSVELKLMELNGSTCTLHQS